MLAQSVLLRGVNDDVETLARLYGRLVDLRVMPYYLHQLDRVAGAAHFEVSPAAGGGVDRAASRPAARRRRAYATFARRPAGRARRCWGRSAGDASAVPRRRALSTPILLRPLDFQQAWLAASRTTSTSSGFFASFRSDGTAVLALGPRVPRTLAAAHRASGSSSLSISTSTPRAAFRSGTMFSKADAAVMRTCQFLSLSVSARTGTLAGPPFANARVAPCRDPAHCRS